jgi:hypothetical protein
MITTTLNRIQVHYPWEKIWTDLLAHLGKTKADDEPLPYSTILDILGLEDALWCCRAEPQHAREWRLYAVWCARQVQHLMSDPRSIAAIDVAERHAHGEATDEELRVAWEAAWAAAWDAEASVAAAAARAAAREVAWDAAWAAAWAAAANAVGNIAWNAAMAAQKAELRRIVS